MPIQDHRLKSGVLTIDALAFATQATNVRLTPDTGDVGDPLEVLSGDTIGTDEETTWTLRVEAVQDFDDSAGFVNFCMQNAGQVVPYVWAPNAAAGDVIGSGVSYNGTVRVRPVEVGGDVNKRLTTSAVFACQQPPTATY